MADDRSTAPDDDVPAHASGDDGPAVRRRRRRLEPPRVLRRVAPGLVVVGFLALPIGMTMRTAMSGARSPVPPVSAAGDGDDLDDEPVDIEDFLDADLLDAVPVGEEDVADGVRDVLAGSDVIDALDQSGIPEVARQAYDEAESELATSHPSCGVRWSLLAAIGRVESDHGRFGGARLRGDGYGTRPIRGIPLDGRPNVALIRDTDRGELDDDTTYDRAVGPMQIIPTTWRPNAADANGDGRRDPDNVFDAAQGAARYLCAGDARLGDPGGRARAVRRYNNADQYVRVVLNLATMYETGDLGAVEDTMDEAGAFDDELDPTWADTGPAPAADPSPEPAPPAVHVPEPRPSTPVPAAVGWAPAMRQVVVRIITTAPPTTGSTTTTTPPPRADPDVCLPRGSTATTTTTVATRPGGGQSTTTATTEARCAAPSSRR